MKTKTNKLTQIFTSMIAISIVPLLSFADGGNRFDGTYNLVRQEVGIKNFNPSDYSTDNKVNEPWICKESLVVNSTEFQDGPSQIRINGFRIEDRTGCYSTYEETPKKTWKRASHDARRYRVHAPRRRLHVFGAQHLLGTRCGPTP